MDSKSIAFLGGLATFGALIGVLADFFSAWSAEPGGMNTAFSVDLDSVRALYRDKPRWTYVLGNYLGVFFLPIHALGFYLVYRALAPANTRWAGTFLALALYVTPIGVGLHGTLAFIGDIVRSGNAALVDDIRDYWQPWAWSVVILYATASTVLAGLILTGRSLYPRWTVLLSPIALMTLTAVIAAVLPEEAVGAKRFLAVTGLNLPLTIFFGLTTWVLTARKES